MRKKLFIILFIALFTIGAYWVKCQLGVNLIKNFAWEKEFPILNVLQKREVILRPRPGTLILRATFDEFFPYMPWSELWSRDEGAVKDELVREGRNGSSCLRVQSYSAKDWAIGHHHLVAVTPGEVFRFAGRVRTAGLASGSLGVVLLDARKDVLYDAAARSYHWNFAAETVRGATDWRAVSKPFTVPEGARYIRFRLTGGGTGTVWFDDIELCRVR